MIDNFLIGFNHILEIYNFSLLIGGLFLGMLFGAVPGLSGVMCCALLIPFTYFLEPIPALVMLSGVYVGAVFGGSISAILFNIPGDAPAMVTTFDGYPLTKKGKAAKALGMAIFASAFGGVIGAIILLIGGTAFAEIAIAFGPPEYFAFCLLGLSIITSLDYTNILNGLISMLAGLLLATVGLSSVSGVERFTFGSIFLLAGFDLLPVALGLFAVSQVFYNLETLGDAMLEMKFDQRVSTQLPTLKELYDVKWILISCSLLGTFIGFLPGAGATIATFLAYTAVKQTSRHPEQFGTGIIEGVAAPESANNASVGGAMIPLLTLGIPGSGVTAIMLAALLLHGIKTGPLLFLENADLTYTVIVGMLIVNFLIILGGFVGVKLFAYAIKMPASVLNSTILLLTIVGAYSSRNDLTAVWAMILFGFVGYFMKKYNYSEAAMVLGFVLGPIAERNFTITVLNKGFLNFFQKPVSATLIIMSVLMFIYPFILKKYVRIR